MDRIQHDRLPLVTDVCTHDAAVLALSVARFVAAGYMTGDVACWDAAYDGAEQVLGEARGQRFVAAMTGIMRALRRERAADWTFMPASCCRVTVPEQDLVRLIELARSGSREAVAVAAGRLAGGPASRLTAAVMVAADLLTALGPDIAAFHGEVSSAPRPAPGRADLLH